VLDMLSEFRLPHWLIIAGSALVALGFVGLIIRRIRGPTSEQYEDPESIDKEIAENLSLQRAEYRRSLARLIHCNLARALSKLDYAIFCEILSLLFGRVLIST
jgi:hypothetical protein